MGGYGAVLGLLLWLTGCSGRMESPTATKDATLGEEFELAPGQSARVGSDGLLVTFEKVGADSRCPVDVQCVWEGDATVVVSLSQPPREKASVELHTSLTTARQATYGVYRVRLVELRPSPRSTVPISPASYRARLLVTPAASQAP